MDSKSFVQSLIKENQVLLDKLRPTETLEADVGKNLNIVALLRAALRSEMEAFEISARWMATTPEPDVKLALARQIGDEAKHYRLIQERLRELGVETEEFNPVAEGYTPMFKYLAGLETTIERMAAGQFTREHIAVVKNQQFIAYCEGVGDISTAQLYRDTIEKDEHFHHLLGVLILEKYATTPELQKLASDASRKTLAIADEMQGIVAQRLGTRRGPGC